MELETAFSPESCDVDMTTMDATLDSLLASTDELLQEIGKNASLALDLLPTEDLSDAKGRLEALSGKVSAVLQKTDAVYTAIDSYAAQYLQSMDGSAQSVSQALNTCAERVDTLIKRYQNLQWDVDKLAGSLPAQLDISRQLLNDFSVSLDRSIRQQTQIRDALSDAAADVSGISSDAVQDRREISSSIASYKQTLNALRSDYRTETQPLIQ